MNLKVNDVLYTKDGRKVGNCMIIHMEMKLHGMTYTLLSDYGNVLHLTESEIIRCNNFHPAYQPGSIETHKNYNFKRKNPKKFLKLMLL